MSDFPPPKWQRIREPTVVFRYVHYPEKCWPCIERDFLSERQRGRPPVGRDEVFPELRDGMSAMIDEKKARRLWSSFERKHNKPGKPRTPLKIGDYIAELRLTDRAHFEIDIDDPISGHLTLKGDPEDLLAAVVRIFPGKEATD